LLLAIPSFAQEYARQEVTVGTGLQSYGFGPYINSSGQLSTDRHYFYSTPSFVYNYNLSPSLALEGSFQPTSPFRTTDSRAAGRETVAMGGAKTGWRGKRLGLYGEVQAGVASFSCGDWSWDAKPYSHCAHLTDFAIEYGGAAEYRVSSRYALRLDAGHLLMTQFDHIVQRYPDGSPFVYLGGAVTHHLDARIGVTRSFGGLKDAKPELAPDRQAWDVGVLFALQPRTDPPFQYLDSYPEWGLWSSWNFSNHVSWDTTVLHSPRNQGRLETISFQSGGRAFEVLSGAKIGVRRDHMGYFALVRPGTITFGETERQLYSLPNGHYKFDNGMFTNPVLETGGAYEVYLPRHTLLRFEAGDAQIFYLPKTSLDFGKKNYVPGQPDPSLFIGFGAGFRF